MRTQMLPAFYLMVSCDHLISSVLLSVTSEMALSAP